MLDLLWAASPIIVVLLLMLGFNWSGSRAGLAGWLTAIAAGVAVFGGGWQLLLVAAGRSLLLALFVLYIIWMALLLYHVVNQAGAIDVIGEQLPRLARSGPAQALLLAWVFASFLQGATGFGVPAAVIAPLLVGLGFAATPAVVMALVGHAWAVTFGSLGSSFSALMAATNLPAAALAGETALVLWLCCLLCGMLSLWAAGGATALARQWPRLIVLTLVMGGGQWLLALGGFWNIAAFGGGLLGLVVAMADFRFGWLALGDERRPSDATLDIGRLLHAFAPYLILIAVIVIGQFLLADVLGRVQINHTFPRVETARGWVTPAGPGRSIDLFGHGGALLLYTSILAFLYFRRRGTFKTTPYRWRPIVNKTVTGSIKTTTSVVTLLAMAVTMEHAGMTNVLAQAISANTGAFFPLLSPFLGALGAFMTGSNTNSNVVFAPLQLQTAQALSISVPLILAAQTAGGALGSVFAPAKVIVGCSTVSGTNDAAVLRVVTVYGLLMVTVIGVLVWLLA